MSAIVSAIEYLVLLHACLAILLLPAFSAVTVVLVAIGAFPWGETVVAGEDEEAA